MSVLKKGKTIKSRSVNTLLNTAAGFAAKIINIIAGLIMRTVFIHTLGIEYAGVSTLFTDILTALSFAELGIGSAITFALYKPLADGDRREVSAIVSAAKRFYLISGNIFLGLCVVLAALYPLAVRNEIPDAAFVRVMILVLCSNTVVDYFYLGKYRVLLMADQRSYVISLCQIIGTVVMTAVTVLLIKLGMTAITVKLSAAVIYLLRSLAVGIYVRRNYPDVRFNETPDNQAFDQRWSALVHQIVGIVVFNTDVVLLTLMLPENALSEVSVYGTYYLVAYGILGLLSALSGALTPSFGNVMARREDETLRSSFSSYEFVFFILTFIAYTCTLVLFYPFIAIYTAELHDAVYLRWPLVWLFTAYGALHCIRLPAQTMVNSAGHYRQTQWRSVFEGFLNLSISLILVRPLGIVGVLIGTCVAFLYRSIDYIVYSANHFLPGTLGRTVWRLGRNLAFSAVLAWLGIRYVMPLIHGWLTWFVFAAAFAVADGVLTLLFNAAFEPDEVRKVWNKAVSLYRSIVNK